ncbi:hypothetical protein [Campylobacter sp. JMF_08 NE1]|uniref:hypothetical protein n=1 Tax=Campylobacter sp. JMF_08 NE1 TaxID=2983821 RepID=UPI0022E9E7FE|nr:hypothetical protein [Campylobacter sp. JMF_08 NE1]MDA3047523.1 hypothetical protein [Campylobacter sp. JMF_08 NE1]
MFFIEPQKRKYICPECGYIGVCINAHHNCLKCGADLDKLSSKNIAAKFLVQFIDCSGICPVCGGRTGERVGILFRKRKKCNCLFKSAKF